MFNYRLVRMIGARGPLANPTYRRLFAAQTIALLGTGLTTVALTLLAYDLAGDDAGEVVGIALALKMVVYVFVAPVIAGLLAHVRRKRLLVTLDLLRAGSVVAMLFADRVWQVYVLIVLVNACSAGFTPTFQALVPEVLADEATYTRALSLSRLAYELENLLSPALAAALLVVTGYGALFAANGVAFACSALLVVSTRLPARAGERTAPGRRTAPRDPAARVTSSLRSRLDLLTAGTRLYLATPRLRGLLALNLAVAAASAMVIVNTVVYVRDLLGRDAGDVAWALGAAGTGAMVVALALPRALERVSDRSAMLAGGGLLVAGLALTANVRDFGELLAVWFLLGAGLSLVQTPSGRLIQRSGDADARPQLFAAQFSLSHACWLLTYPLAGVLGAAIGLSATAWLLTALAAAAVATALAVWPRSGHHVRVGSRLDSSA